MSDYYDISKPFSIENWNKLISDVNEKLEDPPEGDEACEPIDPIEEVTDPHRWSVDDVQEVRDKMMETCTDISFNEELKLWKSAIIDEIETALEEMWCDCCDDEWLHDEDGTQIQLFSYPPSVGSNCFGLEIPEPARIRDVIDGMSIAKSGIKYRRWTVWRPPIAGLTNPSYFFPTIVASGTISCEGNIEYTKYRGIYPYRWGGAVYCSLCNEYCQQSIDDAEETLVGVGNLVYYIQIYTSGAECADCDE